jgi:hypothetical protein
LGQQLAVHVRTAFRRNVSSMHFAHPSIPWMINCLDLSRRHGSNEF